MGRKRQCYVDIAQNPEELAASREGGAGRISQADRSDFELFGTPLDSGTIPELHPVERCEAHE
jgi:hypothetical protein